MANPLIGVTVLVKGTSLGTQTNIDGEFSVNAKQGDVLKFSYIGYRPVELTVPANGKVNLVMETEATALDEVVVTALGIKRAQKALSYNVQTVNGDALTSNKDANFINSLAGKVAGSTSAPVQPVQVPPHVSLCVVQSRSQATTTPCM